MASKITILSGIFLVLLAQSFASRIEELCDEPPYPNVCPFPVNGEVRNVALGKSADQSTTYKYGGEANLAIDGNKDPLFWNSKSCSHTAEHRVPNETVPWLIVDLGERHLVKKVDLYSRKDPCCADRYHDIQVRLGNIKEGGLGVVFSKNPLCNELVGGGKKAGEVIGFDCSPCHAGRYLSVQIVRNCYDCKLPEFNILSICELEIMGFPV